MDVAEVAVDVAEVEEAEVDFATSAEASCPTSMGGGGGESLQC